MRAKCKIWLSVLSLAAFLGGGASAAPTVADEGAGTLNPEELAIDHWVSKSREDRFDPHMCAYAVFMDKTGLHEDARRVFERCAAAGNQYAMPWLSYLEENGYDRPSDPVAAADWDKKLADTGSSLGQFNYGLDILRGHGVERDRAPSVAGGDVTARELASHDYDPESVTPESDKARYRKPQF